MSKFYNLCQLSVLIATIPYKLTYQVNEATLTQSTSLIRKKNSPINHGYRHANFVSSVTHHKSMEVYY